MTNPHSYYCAECRSTFDFHHSPSCTCTSVQDFIVQHRESHEADAKRTQAKASVSLPARQEALTRFWDHNFNEVFPPHDFKYISVDCAGTRWSGLVTQRGKLRSAEKLGLTGDGE